MHIIDYGVKHILSKNLSEHVEMFWMDGSIKEETFRKWIAFYFIFSSFTLFISIDLFL